MKPLWTNLSLPRFVGINFVPSFEVNQKGSSDERGWPTWYLAPFWKTTSPAQAQQGQLHHLEQQAQVAQQVQQLQQEGP